MTAPLTALILPGIDSSGPEHWQSQWERADPACVRVIQDEWAAPRCGDWLARLNEVLNARSEPVVLVAHSAGCALVLQWSSSASSSGLQQVRGVLLVAPADPDGPSFPRGPTGFGPMPLHALPFPSIVVTSTDDPYIDPERASEFADAWRSRFVLLQSAGHINAASGFGPWPEGLALLDSLRCGGASEHSNRAGSI